MHKIPQNAKGLKYYFDKQIPFLQPGKTLSTPADYNFFKVGNINTELRLKKHQMEL